MTTLSAGDVYAGTVDLAMHLIAKHECFYAKAHPDPVGHMEIGYGFSDKNLVAKGTITMAEADAHLRKLVVGIVNNIHKDCGCQRLTPHQEAALVSFIYNEGESNWKSSTLRKYIRSGQPSRLISKEFGRWVYATKQDGTKVVLPGLVKRRAEEASYWMQ